MHSSRADIVAINVDENIEKLKDLFIETGISGFWFIGRILTIVGYIHVWEMFDNPKTGQKHCYRIFVQKAAGQQTDERPGTGAKNHRVVVDSLGTSGVVTGRFGRKSSAI